MLVGLWAHWRAPRTDLARAGYVLWGLWLVTHVVVFSYMSGIFHSYYTVAMALAIAGLTGSGLYDLWRLRGQSAWWGLVAGVALIGTAAWSAQLMSVSHPVLSTLAVVLAVVTSAVVLVPTFLVESLRVRASRGWWRLRWPLAQSRSCWDRPRTRSATSTGQPPAALHSRARSPRRSAAAAVAASAVGRTVVSIGVARWRILT